jgi:hypothetical protein
VLPLRLHRCSLHLRGGATRGCQVAGGGQRGTFFLGRALLLGFGGDNRGAPRLTLCSGSLAGLLLRWGRRMGALFSVARVPMRCL